MAKPATTTVSYGDWKPGLDLLSRLEKYLQESVELGDVSSVAKVVDEIAKRLDAEALDAFKHAAEQHAEDLCRTIGRTIRDRAAQENIEHEIVLPHVRIGCVRLVQKRDRQDQWELSILDSECIERVSTLDGNVLFERALTHIVSIQSAQKQVPDYTRRLELLLGELVKCGVSHIPINVVMVLLGSSRRPDSVLSYGPESAKSETLTRAQFGYVIASARREWTSQRIAWSLVPATQYDTQSPSRYLHLPDDPDPRLRKDSKPFTALQISRSDR